MSVAAADEVDVYVAGAFVRERLEELLDQREGKIFVDQEHLAVHRHLEDDDRTAGESADDSGQRLIERDVGMAEAADSSLVSEGLRERFSQHEAALFDRLVI